MQKSPANSAKMDGMSDEMIPQQKKTNEASGEELPMEKGQSGRGHARPKTAAVAVPAVAVISTPADPLPGRLEQLIKERAAADVIFLAALEVGMPVSRAAELAGVHRQRFHERRNRDPEFAKAWEEAQAAGLDAWRYAAWDRAVNGYHEPVIYQGRPVLVGYTEDGKICPEDHPLATRFAPLTIRRYSDHILAKLLPQMDPQMRERHELSGPDGKPIAVQATPVDYDKIFDELRKAIGGGSSASAGSGPESQESIHPNQPDGDVPGTDDFSG